MNCQGVEVAKACLFALCLAGAPSVANAYGIPTHAYLTYKAYQKSVLNPQDANSIVPVLMFGRLDPSIPWNVNYLDNAPANDDPTLYTREVQDQERSVFIKLINAGRINVVNVVGLEYAIDGWLMSGAIREDDVDYQLPILGWRTDDLRDPDPFGYLFRSSRHFYDPIYDRAFEYPDACSIYGCVPSPQWALGTAHPLTPPGDTIDTARRNHFTWEDARGNYWGALTKKRYPNGGTDADRYASFIEREQRWATAIKSLGHVVHLLEDGAQPQHVRNDAHAPPPANLFVVNAGTGGAYEEFTDYRIVKAPATGLRSALRWMDEGLPDLNQVPDINLDGYPLPQFATAAKFFTTRYYDNGTDPAGVNARRGVMDFANRNFFTTGTYPGFEQCVPPGDYPCGMRDPSPTYVLPENDLTNAAVYTTALSPIIFRLNGYNVKTTLYLRQNTDPVSPTFDASVLPSQFSGKTPVVSRGTLFNAGGSIPLGATTGMNYNNFIYDANVLLPRAVSYSAGLINYFFRARLSVTGTSDKVIAVLNQGAQHTMNAKGYPCVGAATNDGCAIFGFQSIRVAVKNNTPSITESGPSGATVVQKLSATLAGDTTDPNFHGPYLVAVARYHRNTCYKPDLSGERIQPFSGPIVEPTCTGDQTVRTPYQEISVSKSFAISDTLLNSSTASEVHFDFSADPIPVNATDLFIQVVYRGPIGDPAGDQELDGIAVGTLDVREPLFAAFWNNTDYWWTGSIWSLHNGTNHNEGVQSFWVCAGSSSPPKLVFRYDGATGSPAMIDPISGSNVPGVVRVGIIFPPPDFVGQGRTVQGTPVQFSGDAKIPIESKGSAGEIRQANLESISAATLSAPVATCNTALPNTPEYWCFDTVLRRRGQVFGVPAIPLYLAPNGGAGSASDVDSGASPLPAFAGITVLQSGTVRFDTDTSLVSCPAQP